MTTKIFCDRCGKEKDVKNFVIKLENPNDWEYSRILDTDMCMDCFKELKLIIENFISNKGIKFRT
jgi:hypothetical protein